MTFLLAAVLAAPVLWVAVRASSPDILHPWLVFNGFMFALYGVSLILGLWSGSPWVDAVAPGVLLAAVGLDIGIGAGIRFGQLRERAPVDRVALIRWVPIIMVLLIGSGVVYIVRAGGFESLLAPADRIASARAAGNFLLWGARSAAIVSTAILAVWYGVPGKHGRPPLLVLLFLAWTAAFLAGTGWRLDVFAFGLLLICVLRYLALWSNLRIAVLVGLVGAFYLVYGLYRTLKQTDAGTAQLLGTAHNPLDLFLVVSTAQLGDFTYAYQLILSYFPSSQNFLWGRSMMINLATLAPGYQPLFDDYLKRLFNLQFAGGGLNPGIVGELYLTAGYPAILLGTMLLGWLVAVQYKRLRTAPSPQNVMGYGLALSVGGLSIAGGSIDLIVLLVYGAALRAVYLAARSVDRPSRVELALGGLAILAGTAETLMGHAWVPSWMVFPGL